MTEPSERSIRLIERPASSPVKTNPANPGGRESSRLFRKRHGLSMRGGLRRGPAKGKGTEAGDRRDLADVLSECHVPVSWVWS